MEVNPFLLSDEEWDRAYAASQPKPMESEDTLSVYYTPLGTTVQRKYRYRLTRDSLSGLEVKTILLEEPLVREGEHLISTREHAMCIVLQEQP